jgi:hypothetical protein
MSRIGILELNRQRCHTCFIPPSSELPHSKLLTTVMASVLLQMSGESFLFPCPQGSSAYCPVPITAHNALLPTPEKLRKRPIRRVRIWNIITISKSRKRIPTYGKPGDTHYRLLYIHCDLSVQWKWHVGTMCVLFCTISSSLLFPYSLPHTSYFPHA